MSELFKGVTAYNALNALQEMSDSKGRLELDLARLPMSRAGAAVLAVGLLTALRDRALYVDGPPSVAGFVAGSGLAFALAARDRSTMGPELFGAWGDIGEWRKFWVPKKTYDTTSTQIVPDDIDPAAVWAPPTLMGRYHASFVNAHRTGIAGERTPVARNIEPWLLHILPEFMKDSPRETVRDMVRSVSIILNNLMANIREHAGRSMLETESFTHVGIVSRPTGPALVVTVLNTGNDIPRTLRATLKGRAPSLDVVVLRDLLAGDMGYWGRARGFGLPEVGKIVARYPGASLFLASGQGSVIATDGVRVAELLSFPPGFSLPGTVAVLHIPLAS